MCIRDSSSTADTPVSQPDSTESSDSGVTADSAAQDESPLSAPELTLYTTDLANNIGKIGYDEQQMVGGKTRLEMYRDVLKGYNLIPYTTEAGEKITIATGHQVYVKADDTSGQQYIVSGVDPIPVEHLSLIHISEPTRLGMISYAVFCLKKKKKNQANQ